MTEDETVDRAKPRWHHEGNIWWFMFWHTVFVLMALMLILMDIIDSIWLAVAVIGTSVVCTVVINSSA